MGQEKQLSLCRAQSTLLKRAGDSSLAEFQARLYPLQLDEGNMPFPFSCTWCLHASVFLVPTSEEPFPPRPSKGLAGHVLSLSTSWLNHSRAFLPVRLTPLLLESPPWTTAQRHLGQGLPMAGPCDVVYQVHQNPFF